jgi:uncharacterized membrane protein
MMERQPLRTRLSGWGKSALFASLGLNLFFAGWLLGARTIPWGFGPPPGPMQRVTERLRHSLSEDGFRLVNAVLGQLEADKAQHFRDTAPLRDAVKSALAANEFDRAAFTAALADLNADVARHSAQLNTRIAEAVARLSAEDRRRLSELTIPPPPLGPGFLFPDRPGPPPPPR